MFGSRILLGTSVLLLGCSGAGVGTTTESASTNAPSNATSAGETGDPSDDEGPREAESGSADSADPGDDTADPSASGNDSDPSDDSAGETTGSDSDGEPVTLEGAWLSEGANIAPVFLDPTAPAQLTRVEAQFDGTTYTVYANTVQGDAFTLTGTYAVDPCGDGSLQRIVLEQTGPVQASFEGIFEIDGSTDPALMQYEVSQTGGIGWEPGLVPPTCEGGFGSSQPAGTDNVQIYERMP